MIDWAIAANMPLHILLTKADKLNFGAAKGAMIKLRDRLRTKDKNGVVSIQLFSSLNKTGVDELAAKLDSWYLQSADLEQITA